MKEVKNDQFREKPEWALWNTVKVIIKFLHQWTNSEKIKETLDRIEGMNS